MEELRFEPPDKLRALFHHESGDQRVHLQKLLFNLIWQAYTRIRSGKREPIDGNIRTFWYVDCKVPLSRLGLLQNPTAAIRSEWRSSLPGKSLMTPVRKLGFADFQFMESGFTESAFTLDGAKSKPSTAAYLYDTMTNVFYEFVSNGIFRFHDFGFIDDAESFRFFGTKRPDVIFIAEKIGLKHLAEGVRDAFGCVSVCLGGEPKLLSSEYFVEALGKQTSLDQNFTILACVDYDPFGKIIAGEFARQISFFGVEKISLKILITEDSFTEEELERYAHPLPINNKRMQTIVDNWLKETGGVKGKPMGISCDVLPRERIKQLVEAEL